MIPEFRFDMMRRNHCSLTGKDSLETGTFFDPAYRFRVNEILCPNLFELEDHEQI